MFNKLKQFKEMRDKAKNIQNTLAEEKIEAESRGIKILMDGNQKVLSLTIPPQLTAQEIQNIMPGLINDAIKKAQKAMVQKMQNTGQLGNFGL